jgi:hypothetical protein
MYRCKHQPTARLRAKAITQRPNNHQSEGIECISRRGMDDRDWSTWTGRERDHLTGPLFLSAVVHCAPQPFSSSGHRVASASCPLRFCGFPDVHFQTHTPELLALQFRSNPNHPPVTGAQYTANHCRPKSGYRSTKPIRNDSRCSPIPIHGHS